MAAANKAKAETLEVNNLGDVTEDKVLATSSGVPGLLPLKDLPKGYESLADSGAKGFTEVGGMVALHF
jgi:hypothetical protein